MPKMKHKQYRPYVYKRADDLGIPIVDAKAHLRVTVTDEDVVLAKKANSQHCALARAAVRLPKVNAAYFFLSTAFIEYPDKMVRFKLPVSVQKEIVSFDRAQVFASGVYQLSPMPPALTHAARNKQGKVEKRARKVMRAAGLRLGSKVGLSDAIGKIAAMEPPPPDSPEQRIFEKKVSAIMGDHAGKRSVSGIRGKRAPDLLPDRAPTRYVHRTQYVRDLRDPSA